MTIHHHHPLSSFQKENQTKKKIGGYVHIEGNIDRVNFEKALRQVIQEHDVLQITSDGITQTFAKKIHFSLEVQEFSAQNQALEWIKQTFLAPLPQGSLFQFALCHVPGKGDYWLKKYHPLIADEQSVLWVMERVADHYNALQTGQVMSPSKSSYAKYIQEEQIYLHSEWCSLDKQYWQKRASSLFESPILQRNVVQFKDQPISSQHTLLSFYPQLLALSTTHHCSPFQVMLGILYAYFTYVTQREDFVIGFSYRQPSELIGNLTTSLLGRFHYGTQLNFVHLIDHIKQEVREMTQHTRISFSALAHEPESIPKDIHLSFIDSPQNIRFAGSPAEFISLSHDPQGFALSILQRTDQTQFIYRLGAFESVEIEWLKTRFEHLLEEITRHPEVPLDQLQYLPEPERHKLLFEFNDTLAPYPSNQCIHQLFEEQVELRPEAIALVFQGQTITYRLLNQKANQLAHYLQTFGVKAETLVGICMERSMEMIIGLLGILKAGGAYLPLEPEHPTHRLNFMLEDAQVKILLTQEKLIKLFSAITGIICLDKPWEEVFHCSEVNLATPVTTQNLAYVCYTSGSTGQPKGVCVVHQSVVRLVKNTNYAQLTPDHIFLHMAPLAFDASTFEIWACLLNGAKLVVMPSYRPSLGELGKIIQQHQITTLWLSAGLFNLMVDEQLDRLKSVRQLLAGGDALSVPHVNKAFKTLKDCQFINGYGPTENTTFTTYFPIKQPISVGTSVPIGRPIANTQTYVLGAKLQPMPFGVPGELYVGGDGLARGYLNHPEWTAEKFIDHPFLQGARLYKTGDLVRWLSEGHLEFLGRIDHQIKIRGFRVELGEIETVIQQHPEIQEAIVLSQEDRPGDPGDKCLIAYFTMRQQQLDTETCLALWQTLYEQTYRQAPKEETFNITGWNSSYTQQPIPKEEMCEWVEQTVLRIMSLKPNNVLEIGCGMGLLLSKIAPHCQTYVGTDFSPLALEHVRKLQNLAEGTLDHVTLLQRLADDFSWSTPQSFDTIVINSVVQHFPDVDYLLRVLRGAIHLVKPGGHILIGDIRNLAMLETYYTSVQTYQATEEMTCAQLRRKIHQHLIQEEELLLAPPFFFTLKHYFPEITQVQIQPKCGRYHNELTRFRYEAILHIHSFLQPRSDIQWIEWSEQKLTIATIREWLTAHPHKILGIRHIANARLHEEKYTMQWLKEARGDHTVAQLRNCLSQQACLAIEPDDLWNLAQELSYHIELSWLNTHQEGDYDVVFTPHSLPWQPALFSEKDFGDAWSEFANNPLQESRYLIPQLHDFLKDKLPDYMLPKAFVVLEKMPLTPNGKVDRKALAKLPIALELEEPFVAPRNELEQTLASFWGEVLGIERVGIHDDFFELGGNSLKGMVLFHKLQKKFSHLSFQLVDLFIAPTVAKFAASYLKKSSHREVGEI